ncbi:cytochrome P450 [Streptomyces cellulosae]
MSNPTMAPTAPLPDMAVPFPPRRPPDIDQIERDAMDWALELLALRPGIQQRLHTEVDTVLRGAPATHTDLPRLALTERIITEALRLYSPGWFVTRTVTEDTHLGKYSLPAGTSVAYSPYLIHHRPDLYANPETFAPDRWNPRHPQPPPGPLRTGSGTETA